MEKPTAIDLFSGCGGLSEGLKAAGFAVIGAVEKESLAAHTYRLNHPEVRVWEADIRKVSAASVGRELGLRPGELTLIAGCPPCQGFSRLRTLNGARDVGDDRNELTFDYIRFVRALRPKALMFQNVPGLLLDQRYEELTARLRRLGYRPRCVVRDAADFGIPQRRPRLILMAGRGFEVPFPAPEPPENRRTVRAVIHGLPEPGSSGDPAHDIAENRTPRIQALIRRIPPDGGSRKDLGEEEVLECHRRCDGFYDIYGRIAWDDVAPTLTGGFVNPSKGRFLHPEQHRCVTPREAALLQSFPRKYVFPMARGKYAVAEMIGNAFPPRLAQRHAEALASALGL